MMKPLDFLQKVRILNCYFSNTPFTKEEDRRREYIEGDKSRNLTLNELAIEIDLQEPTPENKVIAANFQEINFKRIKESGAAVYLFDHKGKSPWIRLYNIEFKDKDEQKNYYKVFVEKYCEKLPIGFKYDASLYASFKWVPLEFAEHWKYGTKINLIDFANVDKRNQRENDLLIKIKTKKQYPEAIKKTRIAANIRCPICEYALTHKLPEGNRNQVLCKNASTILTDEQLNQLAQTQEMNLQEVIGWKEKNLEYNIFEMINYSREIGLEHLFEEFLEKAVKK